MHLRLSSLLVIACLATGCAGPSGEVTAPAPSPTPAPVEQVTLGAEPSPAPPRPAELGDGTTWTLVALVDEDGGERPPAADPAPSFTIDGGVDPVGDGGGKLLLRTGCGEALGLFAVQSLVMATDPLDADDSLAGACAEDVTRDADALLAAFRQPLTIAIDDLELTLSAPDGRPLLRFTAPRPAPHEQPPVVTVPADWQCTRVDVPEDERDTVGNRDTASRNLEPFLPAALRTEGLEIRLDGDPAGRIEVEVAGPRRVVAVTAYEYCLPPDLDPTPVAPDAPLYAAWTLVDDGGTDQPAGTSSSLVLTADADAWGATACNGYWAQVAADVEGRLRVSNFGAEEADCEDRLGEAQDRFTDALVAATRWELTAGGDLLLHGPTTTLRFSTG